MLDRHWAVYDESVCVEVEILTYSGEEEVER